MKILPFLPSDWNFKLTSPIVHLNELVSDESPTIKSTEYVPDLCPKSADRAPTSCKLFFNKFM